MKIWFTPPSHQTVGLFQRAVLGIALLALCQTSFAVVVGEAAKDFRAASYKSDNFRLAEQQGKVVLLNFWATWCGPCRQQLPELSSMATRLNRKDLLVAGINIDSELLNLESHLKDVKVTIPILLDPTLAISRLYNVETMPITVIIDRNGKVRQLHSGYEAGTIANYEEQLLNLLNEL